MIQFENGKGPQASDTILPPTYCALSSVAFKIFSRTFEKNANVQVVGGASPTNENMSTFVIVILHSN